MIQFTDLTFEPCPNHPDGNSKAFIKIGDLDLDIIKKPKDKVYKIKPFEIVHTKKRYKGDVFPEYGFPEFTSKSDLVTFLNEIASREEANEEEDLQEED